MVVPNGSFSKLSTQVYSMFATILPEKYIWKFNTFDNWLKNPRDNSLIVNVRSHGQMFVDAIQKLNVTNIGIFHMADEYNEHDKEWYKSTEINYVLRNYYFNDESPKWNVLSNRTCGGTVTKSKIFHVPQVGHPAHIMVRYKNIIPATKREHNCGWIGSKRRDRQAMIKFFNTSEFNCNIEIKNSFMGDIGWHYFDSLRETVFILNPAGNNVETIRWGETLNFGTIPVNINDAFFYHEMFMQVPGVYAKSWEDAVLKMEYLLQHPKKLLILQKNVLEFHDSMIKCAKSDLRYILDSSWKTN